MLNEQIKTKETTTQKLNTPKSFNPRFTEVNVKDERFFAFESQRSHH